MSELEERGRAIDAQVANHIRNVEASLAKNMAKLEQAQEASRAAAAMGDRSENAEWQIANDEVAHLTVVIVSLQDTLDTYHKIHNSTYKPTGKITVGSTVKLIDEERHRPLYIKLYPPGLGNAKVSAISIQSPVGRAVNGKRAGERVIVSAPIGNIPYYIEEVL